MNQSRVIMWGPNFVLKLSIKPEETLRRLQMITRPMPHHPQTYWSEKDEEIDIDVKIQGSSFQIYCSTKRTYEGGSDRLKIGFGPLGFSISEKQLGWPTFKGEIGQTEYGSILSGRFYPSLFWFLFIWFFLGSLLWYILNQYQTLVWPQTMIVVVLSGVIAYWMDSKLTIRWDVRGERLVDVLRSSFAYAILKDELSENEKS